MYPLDSIMAGSLFGCPIGFSGFKTFPIGVQPNIRRIHLYYTILSLGLLFLVKNQMSVPNAAMTISTHTQ